ncbi:hypothetical protein EIN_144110 [Entamoeba invadens IP1]|uniref:DUF4190 domain-containing protein n=1 Tax=Entamoeba invadens IP1 TaxID=370355 RepID=A0A0A1UF91_ENTIV|nr:hypothetical protein EIN_144110 [Entamoeba invadens IP1]ELP91481.1 hypothetical protein EIN_144110 [Entamoeba invadens IP1]|eukprot:XP_004258252.1 hypothetical protein EIN_144110 [Entamoeba invadens IP1]
MTYQEQEMNSGYPQQPVYNQPPPQVYVAPTAQAPVVKTKSNDDADLISSLLFFVLGFFCCCIWIVVYRKFKHSGNDSARMFAIISLVFFIISFITSILAVIILFVILIWFFTIGTAVNNVNDNINDTTY